MTAFQLSPRQRRTLAALCHTIVPAAATSSTPVDLPARIEERVAGWDTRRRREFGFVLNLFGTRAGALIVAGSLRRFTDLEPEDRARRLTGMEGSPRAFRRTIFQGLRRTVLSTYYALAESWEGIGYRGPYHLRKPAVEWEGPLRGIVEDAGPVAAEPASPRGPEENGEEGREIRPVRNPGAGEVVRAEVCVIGTGAGGAVAAARLAEAGRDVVLLEAGGFWPPASFDEDEAVQLPRLYAEQANRSTDDLSIPIFQGECVGGGTTVNWMIMLRTPDHVLDEWVAAHGAEGLGAGEMRPVFERIEREVHALPVPDAAHNPNNRIILDGARSLGWTARRARINARDCIRTGHCGLGCRHRAKQDAMQVYLPRAVAAGARLYADARVERIAVAGGARRVEVRGGWRVEADRVILAAGAVGTPVILQRSGLGGPVAGRFLRLHPTTAVKGVFPREIYAAAGIPQSAYCDHFLDEHDGYGFWIEGPPLQPALAALAQQGFGAAHRTHMEQFRRLGVLIVLVRDGAERPTSQGRVWVGRRGRVHIRYRVGAAERRTMREGMEAGLRMLFAAGADAAQTLHVDGTPIRSPDAIERLLALPDGPNQLGVFSAHVNGTARLGTDPAASVCTPDGQVRGAPGVYVMDGSILPTAPGVNPQETIMAVASVLTERLR